MKTKWLVLMWFIFLFGVLGAQWQVTLTTNLDGVEDYLVFGVSPSGSDSFDIGLDMPGPPPPPSGAVLQFRFSHPWISGLTTDIRSSFATELRWDIVFIGAPLPTSASLSWNPEELPDSGTFQIGSAAEGNPVSEWRNMRETSSFNIPIGYNYVQIHYLAGALPPVDTIPPYTMYWSPADGNTNVALDANISVDILDDDSGVDSSSIRLTVAGYPVPSSYIELTPIPGGYHLFFDPPISFPPSTEIVVVLTARDNAHNFMADTIRFITTSEVVGFTVSGQVTLEGTTNYSGTIVVISDGGMDTTDIDGMYSISGVSAGWHTILAYHTGYQSDSARINVVSDTIINFHLFRIISTISISGTITLEGETNHSGTVVTAIHSGGIDSTVTDNLGRYLITNVTPGFIMLRAAHTGFISRDTTFTASSNVVVDMRLYRIPTETWRVFGFVFLEGATNHAGTVVRVYAGAFEGVDTTLASGYFEILNVPTGVYTFAAYHPGYETYIDEYFEVVTNREVELTLARTAPTLPAPEWVDASDGIPYKILVTWGPPILPTPGREIELSSDDGEVDTVSSTGGSFSYIYLGEQGGYMANQFTVPSPGCVLVGFKAMLAFPTSTSYLIVRAWDNAGEDGAPGNEFLLPAWYSFGDTGAYWYEVNIPNIPIPSPTFYLGWEETSEPVLIGVDTDDVDGVSWVYLSDYGWNPLSAFPSPYNSFDLMIRAIVATPSGKIIELSPTGRRTEPAVFSHIGENISLKKALFGFNKPASVTVERTTTRHARARRTLETLVGYRIYRSLSPFDTPTEADLIADLPIETLDFLAYVDSGDVVPGVTYYYGVTAVYVEGESELSPIDSGYCIGAAPPATILIIDWDDGDMLANGGTAQESDVLVELLRSIGVTDVFVTNQNEHLDRFNLTPTNYQAVFIITGAYPQNGYFSDDDFIKLSGYIEAGGKVYSEGVDFGWICVDPSAVGSDASLAFWEYFRTNWDADGNPASTGNVQSLETNRAWSYFGRVINLTYDYQMLADHYVDEFSSNGATAIMRSQESIVRMTAFAAPGARGYKTVASAVYIGAMDTGVPPERNHRARILGSILNFFGIANTGVDKDESILPLSLELYQNIPNPFNSETKFTFVLPSTGEIELSVYDVLGRKISTVAEGKYNMGVHTISWSAPVTTPSGVYFYTLKFENERITRKFVYLK